MKNLLGIYLFDLFIMLCGGLCKVILILIRFINWDELGKIFCDSFKVGGFMYFSAFGI